MQEKIYDQDNAFDALIEDFETRTHYTVKLQSTYISMRGVARLRDPLKKLVQRGVVVCMFLQIPRGWERRHMLPPEDTRFKEMEQCKAALEAIGVHVNLKTKIHTKVIVMDCNILLKGSMNSMSVDPDFSIEELTRFDNSFTAMAAIAVHHLHDCDTCIALRSPKVDAIRFDANKPGAQISEWRNSKGFSQDKVAAGANINRVTVTNVERGEAMPGIDTFAAICSALNKELIAVPPTVVPLVESILKTLPREFTEQTTSSNDANRKGK